MTDRATTSKATTSTTIRMSNDFTQYVKILGRGKKGARSLTLEEAEHAMSLMLSGNVAPEQSGAFWMLIRIREETVEETVGFTKRPDSTY